MAKLLNGRILLGVAIISLAAVAGVMIASGPPETAQTVAAPAASTRLAGGGTLADAAKSAASPAPAAAASPVDERFVIKRILPIDGAIKYGDWHWDETNVPDGPIVVTVDLEARVISVFKGGYEIGASAVLLGDAAKPTPVGIFPITEKKRDHTSNLYDSPMPYMQRLTNDGITLHATKVELGYASHGCIGMPEAFARKVFETTHVGDKVYITRGKMVGVGDSLTS